MSTEDQAYPFELLDIFTKCMYFLQLFVVYMCMCEYTTDPPRSLP